MSTQAGGGGGGEPAQPPSFLKSRSPLVVAHTPLHPLCPDFLRLVIYCLFFLILFNFYSFPLHILRELFVTATSFMKRLKDIIRARRATVNLNTRCVARPELWSRLPLQAPRLTAFPPGRCPMPHRYPNATPEELADSAICAICREEMQSGKK